MNTDSSDPATDVRLQETVSRRNTLWERAAEQGCDLVIIYGSQDSSAAFRHLINFVPVMGDMWALMQTPGTMTGILNFHWELKEACQLSGFSDWQGEFDAAPLIIDQIRKYAPRKLGIVGMQRIPWRILNKILTAIPDVDMVDLDAVADDMRRIKSTSEIDLLQKAARITDEAIATVRQDIRPGMTETDIAAVILNVFNRHAAEVAFRPGVICGVDEACAVIVRSFRSRPIETGDTVMLDIGASYQGYQSDVARSFVVGTPSPKQQKVYSVVKSAFNSVVEQARPGVPCNQLHMTAERIISSAGYELIHRIGHGFGLATSFEWPSLDTETAELVPGMTLCIEPGIYLAGAGAMKIEDMLVITENGCELLSQSPYDLTI